MPNGAEFMIYGATGYTGVLIAEEAVRRGHKPILAGRSREKLEPIGQRLGLPVIAVDLGDTAGLRTAVKNVRAVLHSAGPFIHTAAPMRRACLDAGAHYLDITGEIPVFKGTFALDREARERKVALISGVGFDVVPTDCLAKYVADQVPGAKNLEIAFASAGGMSAGTIKSALEGAHAGNVARRDGKLVQVPFGRGVKRVQLSHRKAYVMPIPWGDLETAYHSTGIPNITTYMAVPSRFGRAMERAWPLLNAVLGAGQLALRSKAIRERLMKYVEKSVKGPSETVREAARSYVWARADDGAGKSAEAWLETLEGYAFTAVSAVLAVEHVLRGDKSGALTPSLAFGTDFVLKVQTTARLDAPLPLPLEEGRGEG